MIIRRKRCGTPILPISQHLFFHLPNLFDPAEVRSGNPPRQNLDRRIAPDDLLPRVDDLPPIGRIPFEPQPPAYPLFETRRIRPRRLDFYWQQTATEIDDQIDLIAGLIAPEIEGRDFSSVSDPLVVFADDERLKNMADQWMPLQIFRAADTQQKTQDPRIDKIQFGCLDHPFGKIPVMRRKQKEDAAGLEE